MDKEVHLKGSPALCRVKLEGTLTVIYSAQSETPRKSRGALLPLLVVLFLISYAILALLVVEQGRTIDAQRNLLREMLRDSTQLATLKAKLAQTNGLPAHDKPAVQPEQKQADPPAQGKATPKAPAKEAKRPGKSARTTRQVPEKPAEDLQDVRRTTRLI